MSTFIGSTIVIALGLLYLGLLVVSLVWAMDKLDDGEVWWWAIPILMIAVPVGAGLTWGPPMDGPYCPYACRRTQTTMIYSGKVLVPVTTVVCDWQCARELDSGAPVQP